MTTRYTVPKPLPDDAAQVLRDLKAAETYDRNAQLTTNRYIAALHRAGWSLRAIANDFDSAAKTVADRAAKIPASVPLPLVPAPSMPPPVEEPIFYTIPAEKVVQLKELQVLVRMNRGTKHRLSPESLAGYKLAWMYNEEILNGAKVQDLATATGVPHGLVSHLLGRYGYRYLPPSQEHSRLIEVSEARARRASPQPHQPSETDLGSAPCEAHLMKHQPRMEPAPAPSTSAQPGADSR